MLLDAHGLLATCHLPTVTKCSLITCFSHTPTLSPTFVSGVNVVVFCIASALHGIWDPPFWAQR